jgi:hypothetical protein
MPRITLKSFIVTAALVVSCAGVARAQDEERKWEVGFQFSALSATNGEASITSVLPCINPPCPLVTTTSGGRQTEPGVGARVGYSFNRYLAVEGEVNFFPRERELRDLEFNGGRKLQGLFGVKVGRRYERVGLFAKARPGFVHFAEGDLKPRPNVGCIAVFPPPLSCFEPESRTDFAFDVGGVLELYPSSRTVVRLDAGDTILRTAAHRVPLGVATFGGRSVAAPAATTHNFQGSVGFGFRF